MDIGVRTDDFSLYRPAKGGLVAGHCETAHMGPDPKDLGARGLAGLAIVGFAPLAHVTCDGVVAGGGPGQFAEDLAGVLVNVEELEAGFVREDAGTGAPTDDGFDLNANFGGCELDEEGFVDCEGFAAADAHTRRGDVEDDAEVALHILATDAAVSPLWMSIGLHAHRVQKVGGKGEGVKVWRGNGGGVFAKVPSVRVGRVATQRNRARSAATGFKSRCEG